MPRILLTVVVTLLISAPVLATPINDDNSLGPKKWKDPIKVYIPLDPVPGRTRHVQIKAAVDAWKDKLAGQGTGLDISTVTLDAAGNDPNTHKPPPKDGGAVIVSWTSDKTGEANTDFGGEDTGEKGKDPDGKETPILKNQTNSVGFVQITKDSTAKENLDNDKALKIMMHEFGHILGLDHEDKADSVMQKDLASYQDLKGPGAGDLDEVKSIYLASSGSLTPRVTPVPGGFDYSYVATWVAGGDIPLVQVLTPLSDVRSFTMPPGWAIVPPDPGWPLNIVHLRVAPTDDLTAYLNANNPSLTFSFFSPMPPGETLGWIGDVVHTIGPVPEPSSIALMVIGLLLLLHYRRC